MKGLVIGKVGTGRTAPKIVFFEQANGNCRLMGPFAAQLSETAGAWRRAVSPYAEQAAKIFWQGRSEEV